MKTYPYGIISPVEIPEVADRILEEYFQIVTELGIKSCIAYGLCLGFFRDGGYIASDNDLDVIAISPMKESIDKLSNDLIEKGFIRGSIFQPPANNTHFHKDRILLDVFFRKPEGFYSSFDKVKYKDKEYPIPHPVEEYLNACYTNWRVPENEDAHYYD